MDYKIVEADTAERLANKVKFEMNDGWALHAGVAVIIDGQGHVYFYQAMIRVVTPNE